MDKMYNLLALSRILSDHDKTLQWLREIELISEDNLNLKNSWFENCHTTVATCIFLTYCFSLNFNVKQTIRECSIVENQQVTLETVADRFTLYRELCMISLVRNLPAQKPIGGEGIVVEIDEYKIGSRKHELGKAMEGSWILAFIEVGSTEKCQLEIYPDDDKRDKEFLLSLLKKHVLAGTEIHTKEEWFDIESLGYVHRIVDYSIESDTEDIKSSWYSMKYYLSSGGICEEKLDEHLCEFLWRRRVKYLGEDPFNQLLKEIRIVYSGKSD